MKRIPGDHLGAYFEAFTKRYLLDAAPERVDVEVLEPRWGDWRAVEGVRLMGITYDPHESALEFELEPGDHRVYHPVDVWVVEEPDGFVSGIDLVRADGTREVVRIQRMGVQRVD
ncbi:MAG TPA: DUF5335 family protein [Gemmatimonadaceae bacterium]|nr:DUF5335 family protein [Gemmatimonadaceae bacterium]